MIPVPVSVFGGDGVFVLTPDTPLACEPALAGVASWLRGALGPPTGCALPPGDGGITLALAPDLPASGYRLAVTRDSIRIDGGNPAGVFYGAQTLRQLLPAAVYRRAFVDTEWTVPAGVVTDAPRYGWRGCLLDVARHFMPVADVLRFVDLLAVHKLNVLHLHLTDDQGWRMEVPRYPRLTEVGAWRRESMVGSRHHDVYDGRPHGGYYTRDDLREIVAYAAARHVTVVPEIDLPGHTQAAIAAYPWLGNGETPEVRTAWGVSRHVLNVSGATLEFCRHVLDDVCELFPGRYVCVGGDECAKGEWLASPAARERIAALGLGGVEGLQSWFIRQLADHLATRGRRLYGWDEILEGGAPPGATVAAWRGPYATVAAARSGHDVVACPDLSAYLDYRQSPHPDEPVPVGTLLTVDDVRDFEPVPDGLSAEEAARIVGVQCNVWTEHMDSARAVDYMVFPRLCAFSEVAWGARDRAGFGDRLAAHLPRLDALGVAYRPPAGPRPWQTRPDARGWPRDRAEREAQLAALTANIQPGPGSTLLP